MIADPPTLLGRQELLAGYLLAGFPALGLPGIPAISCAAVVGNATQENNCKSVTAGALDHGSNGLMQWRLTRLTAMEAFAVKNFGSWEFIEPQAAFFLQECKTGYPATWAALAAGTKSLATLTADICDFYEIPAAASANLDGRIAYATTFMAAWKPSTPSAPVLTPVPTSVPTPAPVIVPAPIGATPLNPFILALFDAFANSLVKAVLAQTGISLPVTATVVTSPAAVAVAPTIDPAAIVEALLPALLGSSLPGQLAEALLPELAKLIPTTAAKP
jgi:hypothetical protein